MWKSLGDFQGRWEEWETGVWFSTLSTARHFHSLRLRQRLRIAIHAAPPDGSSRTTLAWLATSGKPLRCRWNWRQPVPAQPSFGRGAVARRPPEACEKLPTEWHRFCRCVSAFPWHRLSSRAGRKAGGNSVRVEMIVIELMDGSGVFAFDMKVAHLLAHHRAVLGFHQPVVVRVARPRFRLFNE